MGSKDEVAGRTGFAHLFEHLMFQGSLSFDNEFFAPLQEGGASINGTTSFDRTNYFEYLPSQHLPRALFLESDRMGYLLEVLTQEKLDNQREVVMNERRQSIENVPYGPRSEKLFQTIFPKDPPYYGYIIGSMADLQAASLEDVFAFYDRYYAPGNASLVIAGDFDPAQAKQLVEKYFAPLPPRKKPDPVVVKTPPIVEEKRVTIEEPVQLPRMRMAWLSPSFYAAGDAECDVLAYILGKGKTSRLYQRLVYDLQIAQSVSASQQSLYLTSIFTVDVTARPGVSLETQEKEVQKVIDEIKANRPSEREVTRAKNLLVTGMVSSLQKIGRKADILNHYNLFRGTPEYLNQDLGRYRDITPDSVNVLANSLLINTQRAVVITVPKS